MKKTLHGKVITIANKLVTQGYNRANAMVNRLRKKSHAALAKYRKIWYNQAIS